MRPLNYVLEEKTFKDDEAFENIAELPPAPLNQRCSYHRQRLLLLCAHLSLILIHIVVATAIMYSNRSSRSHGPDLVYCKELPKACLSVTYSPCSAGSRSYRVRSPALHPTSGEKSIRWLTRPKSRRCMEQSTSM